MNDLTVELAKRLQAADEEANERALLVRLGNVLFWVCYALTAVLAVFEVWMFVQPPHSGKLLALFFSIAFGCTSSIPRATEPRCSKPSASLAWRGLFQKTRCTLSLRAVESLDQSQKSEGTGRDAGNRRDFLIDKNKREVRAEQ